MKLIDMENGPRARSYNFFRGYEFPQFNICTQMDITRTHEYLDRHGISKFNAILWMISAAANAVPEIRYRIQNDRVVEHDRVDPSFTQLTDEKTLAFCNAHYTPDVSEFFKRVMDAIEKTKVDPEMADEPGVDNLLFVSCIPWVHFTSISHPMRMDCSDSIPRISWGRFLHKNGEVLMPISLQMHHGLADGYHAGLFFQELERLFTDPEEIEWPIGR